MSDMQYDSIPLRIVNVDSFGIHVFVSAYVGRKKINMLIDTGASRSVFDYSSILFAGLQFERVVELSQSSGINAEINNLFSANINCFRIGKMVFRNQKALFMSFDHINSMYRAMNIREISAILGANFLMRYQAQLDFGTGQLSLCLNKGTDLGVF